MSQKINFSEITTAGSFGALQQKLDEIMSRCTPDDPIYLSDVLANVERGGQHILERLAERTKDDAYLPDNQRIRWHLEVIRDEFGDKPKPGDKVRLTYNRKPVDAADNPVPGWVMNAAKRDGTFEQRFQRHVEYVVDDAGCINVFFDDAVFQLINFGIHGKSGAPLCRPQMTTKNPVKRSDGSLKHVWYWRYREVDADEHKRLLEDGRPKRTRRTKAEMEAAETETEAVANG